MKIPSVSSDCREYFHTLVYPDVVPKPLFRESVEFVPSTLRNEDELRAEENQAFWKSIINAVDEHEDESIQDAANSPLRLNAGPGIEYVESDGSSVSAART